MTVMDMHIAITWIAIVRHRAANFARVHAQRVRAWMLPRRRLLRRVRQLVEVRHDLNDRITDLMRDVAAHRTEVYRMSAQVDILRNQLVEADRLIAMQEEAIGARERENTDLRALLRQMRHTPSNGMPVLTPDLARAIDAAAPECGGGPLTPCGGRHCALCGTAAGSTAQRAPDVVAAVRREHAISTPTAAWPTVPVSPARAPGVPATVPYVVLAQGDVS